MGLLAKLSGQLVPLFPVIVTRSAGVLEYLARLSTRSLATLSACFINLGRLSGGKFTRLREGSFLALSLGRVGPLSS